MKFLFGCLLVVITSAFSLQVNGQGAIPPQPSPNAVATLKYEDTYIKITYCQPHKRGRETFGGMIPYGRVWRTGANEATEITVTKDILFGNRRLKAGTYSLFSIPQPDNWTIIINSELGQWGAYEYNKTYDVIRISAPARVVDQAYEPFTISFEQTEKNTNLLLRWDHVLVTIPIQFI